MSFQDISLKHNIIPTGGIILWCTNVIPNGWKICDGSSNTPNLISKFILCGNILNVNETGGSYDLTLITANIPAHTHSSSTTDNGTTGISIASGGKHSHRTIDKFMWNDVTNYLAHSTMFSGAGAAQTIGNTDKIAESFLTSEKAAHTHTVTDNGHTHDFTTSSVGSGTTITLPKPSYYVLIYIMKT